MAYVGVARDSAWTACVQLLAALGAGAVFAGALPAARGELDPTFGTGGKVTSDFGGSEFGRAVAVQRDRRVVVVGERWKEPFDFLLARYTANGELDPSFDGDGKVVTDVGGASGASDVDIQRDGKIVVAGWSVGSFALARYEQDGSLDATFGEGGKVRTTFRPGSIDGAYAVALQIDGKIVAGGRTRAGAASAFALARYGPDGRLDPSFGSGGRVITPIPGRGLDRVFALAVQPDGKLVAAGGSFEGDSEVVLTRYNQDGSLDTSLDGDGIAVASFKPIDMVPQHLAVQRDGKLLVPGYGGIVRFTSNGSLDRTFGRGGRADMCCFDTAAAAIQPDGKILTIGTSFSGGTGDFSVARLTADGRRDDNYEGVVTDLSSGSNDQAFDGVLLPDGKLIVAGGTGRAREPEDFAVARYVAVVHCVAPNVRGRTLAVARSMLSRARCRVGAVKRAYSQRVKKGRIISQRPGPRARLPELAKIQLVISRGRKR
ncbi:MAG: PASTA domain-containing protein [Actinobacteria bacterium]|nr:PASTA domain-containing protein [Actinomycetota bacterium]